MTNLSISTVCNLHCPYCFTADYANDTPDVPQFLSLDDFAARLDYLDRSGIDQVRLLGGEPTLHPQFPQLIAMARARNKSIMVFSNGVMPEKALACLEALPPEVCSVLMNVNAPGDNDSAVIRRERAAMARLGERIMPGFNIYRPDFDLHFLLEIIAETGCKPMIRLGLAQPCLSGANTFIHPKQYAFIGQKIAAFARDAAPVQLDFDCGFVPCMFAEDDLAALKQVGTHMAWVCSPILDVDLRGEVIPCYPLSRVGSIPLTPEMTASDLRQTFTTRTEGYRRAGIYAICSSCALKISGECAGGCLAAVMRRFRPAAFRAEGIK